MVKSITFCGGGSKCIYQLGIVKFIHEHPEMFTSTRYLGCSAGSIVAVLLASGLSYDIIENEFTLLVYELSRMPMYKTYTMIPRVLEWLHRILPNNIHDLCNDRVFISCTRLFGVKNRVISRYHSRQDLIDAVSVSLSIPFIQDNVVRKFRGEYYIDGGFSNNVPTLDDETLVINFIPSKHKNLLLPTYKLPFFLYIPDYDESKKIIEYGYQDFDNFLRRSYVYPKPNLLWKSLLYFNYT